MTSIQLGYHNLQENRQHNRATEEQARNELDEARRHNIVFERENNRHNIAAEMLESRRVDSQVALNSAQAIQANANATKARIEAAFTGAKKNVYDKYGERSAQYEQGILYHQRESAAFNARIQEVNRDVAKSTKSVQVAQQYAGIIGSLFSGAKTFGEAATAFGKAGSILYN